MLTNSSGKPWLQPKCKEQETFDIYRGSWEPRERVCVCVCVFFLGFNFTHKMRACLYRFVPKQPAIAAFRGSAFCLFAFISSIFLKKKQTNKNLLILAIWGFYPLSCPLTAFKPLNIRGCHRFHRFVVFWAVLGFWVCPVGRAGPHG